MTIFSAIQAIELGDFLIQISLGQAGLLPQHWCTHLAVIIKLCRVAYRHVSVQLLEQKESQIHIQFLHVSCPTLGRLFAGGITADISAQLHWTQRDRYL
jgi:hypothetical protein